MKKSAIADAIKRIFAKSAKEEITFSQIPNGLFVTSGSNTGVLINGRNNLSNFAIPGTISFGYSSTSGGLHTTALGYDLSKVINDIYTMSNGELLERCKQYCVMTLLTKAEKGNKEITVAHKGDELMPLVVYYNHTTDSFKWDLEDDVKLAEDDWRAIPEEQVFELPFNHKLLNRGITRGSNTRLIILGEPVPREFPSVQKDDEFFSWYVGFVTMKTLSA